MAETIEITLPATLPRRLDATGMLLGSLWQALPVSPWARLAGAQAHVSLEIASHAGRVAYRLWAPTLGLATIVRRQLKAFFPDVQIAPAVEADLTSAAVAMAELRLNGSSDTPLRTLKVTEAEPLAGMLASLAGLRHDAWGLVQMFARPTRAHDLDAMAFAVLIRLAAGAPSAAQAEGRLRGMVAAFGAFGERTGLRTVRPYRDGTLCSRWLMARYWPAMGRHHVVLTRDELATLYHFPAPAEVRNRYLATMAARRLPLPAAPPRVGVAVGEALRDDETVSARARGTDLLRHLLVLGATGTGKSTLLCQLALGLVGEGAGLTVLDPHGSLIQDVLARLPEHRLDDAIVMRCADVDYPFGLNFLAARAGFEFLTVDELVEICQRIYSGGYWGPVLDMMLRQTAFAALETGGTLLEMARMLDDDAYRESITSRIRNPETRRFLTRLSALRDGRREQQTASTLHRLQRFVGTPFIRNIVGQQRSAINARRVMDRRQILLVDLSGIGMDNARFLGSMLTLLYRQAALSREELPEARRAPHYLVMDECSWFLSSSVGEMADQARKFGLGLILATQRLGQLKTHDVQEALFAEAGSLITFRVGDVQEAGYLARYVNTDGLTPEDIRSLGRYEAYAQLLQDGARLPAFWARTLPPMPEVLSSERIRAVIERSRRQYGCPRAVVEEEIEARSKGGRHAEPEKRRR